MIIEEVAPKFDESYIVVFSQSVNPQVPSAIAAAAGFAAGNIRTELPKIEFKNVLKGPKVPTKIVYKDVIKQVPIENPINDRLRNIAERRRGRLLDAFKGLKSKEDYIDSLESRMNEVENNASKMAGQLYDERKRREKVQEINDGRRKQLSRLKNEMAEVEKRVAITSALNRNIIMKSREMISREEIVKLISEKDSIIKRTINENISLKTELMNFKTRKVYGSTMSVEDLIRSEESKNKQIQESMVTPPGSKVISREERYKNLFVRLRRRAF